MKQLGLTDARLMKRSKKTRKEQFLEEMNAIIPWQHLLAAIEPHSPQAARGRRRVALETMLRVHLLQHLFNYSDTAMEEVSIASATGKNRAVKAETGMICPG